MEEIRKTVGDEYGFGSKFDIFGAEGKYPPGFTKDKFGAIFGKTVDDVTGETFEKFRLSPSGKHLPTDAEFQQGGYLRQYNIGGSVAQQPMSYQLGGLLKYKRNPMVG